MLLRDKPIASPLNYIGGKYKLLPQIFPLFPDNVDTFVDIFCGSCSVIEKVPNNYKRIANDKQKYLIAMWKSLTQGKQFPKVITKPFYDNSAD